MSSTKILIDGVALGGDSAYRGIGTYVRRLLEGLASRDDLETAALVRRGTPLPEGIQRCDIHRFTPGTYAPLEHEVLLPWNLFRADSGVIHSPALDPPWRSPRPWVQTLHDVIPLVFEDPELERERRRWRRHATRYRRADKIIAVSRYTADVGSSVLGLPRQRIEVIPHGVGGEFQPPPAGDERRHLLLVGEYSRRKGYQEAFAVVAALAELGYSQRLKVAGRIAPWVRPVLESVVAESSAPERVELLGFVDDLVGQYQRAQVLIMSSRYEGFGLPVLEAMGCGTPVVGFANSSLIEVVGEAGILVPDGDVPGMTRAVRSLLDDRALWLELSARGLERAQEYSWSRSVAAHAELFASLASRRRSD